MRRTDQEVLIRAMQPCILALVVLAGCSVLVWLVLTAPHIGLVIFGVALVATLVFMVWVKVDFWRFDERLQRRLAESLAGRMERLNRRTRQLRFVHEGRAFELLYRYTMFSYPDGVSSLGPPELILRTRATSQLTVKCAPRPEPTSGWLGRTVSTLLSPRMSGCREVTMTPHLLPAPFQNPRLAVFTDDDTRAQRFLADPVVVQVVEEVFAKSAATPCSGLGGLYKYMTLFTIDDGLMSFRCEGPTQRDRKSVV